MCSSAHPRVQGPARVVGTGCQTGPEGPDIDFAGGWREEATTHDPSRQATTSHIRLGQKMGLPKSEQTVLRRVQSSTVKWIDDNQHSGTRVQHTSTLHTPPQASDTLYHRKDAEQHSSCLSCCRQDSVTQAMLGGSC